MKFAFFMNWKSSIFLLLSIIVFNNWSCLFCQSQASAKIWKGNGKGDGSVHTNGNGKMMVYENGPNIIKIYPAPYSTPSILKLDIIDSAHIETGSSREQGTAILTHQVFQSGKPIGTFVDFVDSELPCMIRHFTGPLSTAALVHLLGSSSPSRCLMELAVGEPGRPDYYNEDYLNFEKGKLYLNPSSGPGVKFNPKKAEFVIEVTAKTKYPHPILHSSDRAIHNW